MAWRNEKLSDAKNWEKKCWHSGTEQEKQGVSGTASHFVQANTQAASYRTQGVSSFYHAVEVCCHLVVRGLVKHTAIQGLLTVLAVCFKRNTTL